MLILGILVFGMGIGWVAQKVLGRATNWGEALASGLIGSFLGAVIFLAILGAVRGRSASGK